MAAVRQRTVDVGGTPHHFVARRYADTSLLSISAGGALGAVYNAVLTPPGPDDDGSGVSGVELDAVLGGREGDVSAVVGRRVAAAVLRPGESLTLCLHLPAGAAGAAGPGRREYVVALVDASRELLE